MKKRFYSALLLMVLVLVITAWGCVDNGDGNTIATPLPPDLPSWYTPEPTADYGVWPTPTGD